MADQPYVLLLDNHDSFTFNLLEAFAALGARCDVVRSDSPVVDIRHRATLGDCRLLVISPGPGHPADAGCSMELIRQMSPDTPILGVCLGHQAIVEAFGGTVGPGPEVVHGMARPIEHNGHALFDGVGQPVMVGRYHSLVATRIPEELEVIAWEGRLPMAVAHRRLPIYGFQFHPESILTVTGPRLLANVLALALQSPAPALVPCSRD